MAATTRSWPYAQEQRHDRRALVQQNDPAFERVAATGLAHAQSHQGAQATNERWAADRVRLQPAREAAGSLMRVICEQAFFFTVIGLCCVLDFSGGMVAMQGVSVPVQLPVDIIRLIGALCIGLIIAGLPVLAARSYMGLHRLAPDASADERRAAAARRGGDVRRAILMVAVALAFVGVIGYARTTSPKNLEGASFGPSPLAISPLDWKALVVVGVVTVLLTLLLETYMDARRGAARAHWASGKAAVGERKSARDMARFMTQLQQCVSDWTALRTLEERSIRQLSIRMRALHHSWVNGARAIVVDLALPPVIAEEVLPAPLDARVTPVEVTVVNQLEHAAARLLCSVDPFAVVVPRRDLPDVLRQIRRSLGVGDAHHA